MDILLPYQPPEVDDGVEKGTYTCGDRVQSRDCFYCWSRKVETVNLGWRCTSLAGSIPVVDIRTCYNSSAHCHTHILRVLWSHVFTLPSTDLRLCKRRLYSCVGSPCYLWRTAGQHDCGHLQRVEWKISDTWLNKYVSHKPASTLSLCHFEHMYNSRIHARLKHKSSHQNYISLVREGQFFQSSVAIPVIEGVRPTVIMSSILHNSTTLMLPKPHSYYGSTLNHCSRCLLSKNSTEANAYIAVEITVQWHFLWFNTEGISWIP